VISIAVYIDSLIKLYAAKDIVSKLASRGHRLNLYGPETVRNEAKNIVPEIQNMTDSNSILKSNRFARFIHRRLLAAADCISISTTNSHRLKHRNSRFAFLNFFFSVIFRFGKPCDTNSKIEALISAFTRNPFKEDTVLVVSRPFERATFCASKLTVITLMESWDHPSKERLGFTSDLVITWNENTAKDWTKYQGDRNTIAGFPSKLAYALSNHQTSIQNQSPQEVRSVLYPMTLCSLSRKDEFEEEKKLVRHLSISLMKNQISLLVKPKPNSLPNELDQLSREFANIQIGNYNRQTNDTYSLTSNYNQKRIDELKSVDAVLNLGTTFGLDAAAFGLPVIQLKINDKNSFPLLSQVLQFDHLKSVFFCDPADYYSIKNPKGFDSFAENLQNLAQKMGSRNSERLREWLIGGVNQDNWCGLCCDAIENCIG